METFAANASSINQMDSMPVNEEMSLWIVVTTWNIPTIKRALSIWIGTWNTLPMALFSAVCQAWIWQKEKERDGGISWAWAGKWYAHSSPARSDTALEWNACVDAIKVFSATTRVLEMVPDDPGTWLYRCHVNEHIDNGMEVLFTVRPANSAGTIG